MYVIITKKIKSIQNAAEIHWVGLSFPQPPRMYDAITKKKKKNNTENIDTLIVLEGRLSVFFSSQPIWGKIHLKGLHWRFDCEFFVICEWSFGGYGKQKRAPHSRRQYSPRSEVQSPAWRRRAQIPRRSWNALVHLSSLFLLFDMFVSRVLKYTLCPEIGCKNKPTRT